MTILQLAFGKYVAGYFNIFKTQWYEIRLILEGVRNLRNAPRREEVLYSVKPVLQRGLSTIFTSNYPIE